MGVTYCINSPVPLFKKMYQDMELFSRRHHEGREVNRSCLKVGVLYLRECAVSLGVGCNFAVNLLSHYISRRGICNE